MGFQMVAILGRGIQQLTEGGPWVLTEDLELCDKNSAHLPVRAPADDTSPYCMVGGGEMNLEAGIHLIRQYHPVLVVCAYGARSSYLESVDGPSESEVMSAKLKDSILRSGASIGVWERHRQLPVPSNTRQELLNIFDLAIKANLESIAIVTVGVHVARTATYVTKHMSTYPQYRHLRVVPVESEEVLLVADRNKYEGRVQALRNSQAFARNWEREAVGISKIVRDVYNDATKPLVATTAA